MDFNQNYKWIKKKPKMPLSWIKNIYLKIVILCSLKGKYIVMLIIMYQMMKIGQVNN
jgi:hypothetical protein